MIILFVYTQECNKLFIVSPVVPLSESRKFQGEEVKKKEEGRVVKTVLLEITTFSKCKGFETGFYNGIMKKVQSKSLEACFK